MFIDYLDGKPVKARVRVGETLLVIASIVLPSVQAIAYLASKWGS
jgi:hypothetical protein